MGEPKREHGQGPVRLVGSPEMKMVMMVMVAVMMVVMVMVNCRMERGWGE